jgi:hypothetical protein
MVAKFDLRATTRSSPKYRVPFAPACPFEPTPTGQVSRFVEMSPANCLPSRCIRNRLSRCVNFAPRGKWRAQAKTYTVKPASFEVRPLRSPCA